MPKTTTGVNCPPVSVNEKSSNETGQKNWDGARCPRTGSLISAHPDVPHSNSTFFLLKKKTVVTMIANW